LIGNGKMNVIGAETIQGGVRVHFQIQNSVTEGNFDSDVKLIISQEDEIVKDLPSTDFEKDLGTNLIDAGLGNAIVKDVKEIKVNQQSGGNTDKGGKTGNSGQSKTPSSSFRGTDKDGSDDITNHNDIKAKEEETQRNILISVFTVILLVIFCIIYCCCFVSVCSTIKYCFCMRCYAVCPRVCCCFIPSCCCPAPAMLPLVAGANKCTVAVAQLSAKHETDPNSIVKNIETMIIQAAEAGAKLIVFPAMTTLGGECVETLERMTLKMSAGLRSMEIKLSKIAKIKNIIVVLGSAYRDETLGTTKQGAVIILKDGQFLTSNGTTKKIPPENFEECPSHLQVFSCLGAQCSVITPGSSFHSHICEEAIEAGAHMLLIPRGIGQSLSLTNKESSEIAVLRRFAKDGSICILSANTPASCEEKKDVSLNKDKYYGGSVLINGRGVVLEQSKQSTKCHLLTHTIYRDPKHRTLDDEGDEMTLFADDDGDISLDKSKSRSRRQSSFQNPMMLRNTVDSSAIELAPISPLPKDDGIMSEMYSQLSASNSFKNNKKTIKVSNSKKNISGTESPELELSIGNSKKNSKRIRRLSAVHAARGTRSNNVNEVKRKKKRKKNKKKQFTQTIQQWHYHEDETNHNDASSAYGGDYYQHAITGEKICVDDLIKSSSKLGGENCNNKESKITENELNHVAIDLKMLNSMSEWVEKQNDDNHNLVKSYKNAKTGKVILCDDLRIMSSKTYIDVSNLKSNEWKTMTDPDTGDDYYVNTITGQSVWELPDAMKTSNKMIQANEWITKTDPATGVEYYVNTITGLSVWELPETQVTFKAIAAAKKSAKKIRRLSFHLKNKNLKQNKKINENDNKTIEPNRESKTVKKALQYQKSFAELLKESNWVSQEDDLGRVYYYNELDGRSQWEKPEGIIRKLEKKNELDQIRNKIMESMSSGNIVDGGEVDNNSLHEHFGIDINSTRGEWIEVHDERTNLIAYFNRKTEEIQLKRPKGWVKMLSQAFNNEQIKEMNSKEKVSTSRMVRPSPARGTKKGRDAGK
jgi:predicted amidohydrolase